MSVTISLSDEAYRRLKGLKEEGKSFSDVVMDLTAASRNDFSSLIGADINIEWEDVKDGRTRTEEDEHREELLS